MKKTKIAIIWALALIFAVALCSVCTATSSDDVETINLDGITFNVPDGYAEVIDDNYTSINETYFTDEGSEYVFNEKYYKNDDGKQLMITVSSFVNEKDYYVAEFTPIAFGDEKTVNGVEGHMTDSESRFTTFAYYAGDGKLVMISAEDPNIFEDIVVSN